ncbi:Uncharacterised protein [Streptococcus pneumoniae]|uniref:Uncharacterized protein n=1 Tax=Streptococcus pneumoniae TaxID=1313 RepID=A0A4G1WGK7_STREE|nr:Uncharacterised protein [Streptococcus pneumoniae]VIQ23375.1 Uncharacterised protein [Streptococcus pneumoniae]VIR85399.1 Uncharacterised protein [Streptococcus pneumoniae]VIS94347.1 Uncharacterised protein [Streptococcus pneumoniae]VIX21236.1 Uncharacterised protein [Streptococcus pneumoniae]
MRFYCEAYEVITEEKKVYFNPEYTDLLLKKALEFFEF